MRVSERERRGKERGRKRERGGDRLLTFIFIRHKVFNLDMDKETGRAKGIVVLVSEGHMPEPSPEVVAGQHPLSHQHMVIVHHYQTYHGQFRQ